MFQRYTEKARRVVFFARQEASRHGTEEIGTVGLLLGLLGDNRELMARLLAGGAAELEQLQGEVDALHPKTEKTIPTSMDLPLTVAAQQALLQAAKEADKRNQKSIELRHVLLGLLKKGGPETACLKSHGITVAAVNADLEQNAELQ